MITQSISKVTNSNNAHLSKIFDVKKYVVPHGSSSSKDLPSSESSSSEDGADQIKNQQEEEAQDKNSSNESMKSVENDMEVPVPEQTPRKVETK